MTKRKRTFHLTSLKFDKMKHDFGKVKEDTDNKTFFTVTNTGQNPLVIESVKASCGCTTPSKPEKPIAPGKSDKIEVVFHPKVGQLKQQNKTIRVVANTVPSETVLNVRAFCREKNKLFLFRVIQIFSKSFLKSTKTIQAREIKIKPTINADHASPKLKCHQECKARHDEVN